ncbi:MAG: cysteine desulfurase [Candidatus Delongbacteria bacterium]|jgi:cysteine desulfurase/selenocysteine lyase|nr:cysteine desulfurase [Candidatus Delongbacteria bacterium]
MNVSEIRKDFPVLSQTLYNKPLIYLDNAATTQKPIQVFEAVEEVYKKYNANIHRGIHYLSELCTTKHEDTRQYIADYINAASSNEIVFTRGTTESINLVANGFAETIINKGDEIIVTEMEHHSNFVPWQMLCKKKNATFVVLEIEEDGSISIEKLKCLITEKTKLIALTHVSNVLGTINPVKEVTKIAHQQEIPVLVDAAQSIQHMKVDVKDMDCDFMAFSGHKLYGPTGIGVLYAKEKWLEKFPPYQYGGEMIQNVSIEKTTFNKLPFKFEAGTPNYIGAIGMGAALKYIEKTGIDDIVKYEKQVYDYAVEKLSTIDNIQIYGTSKERISVISFNIEGLHPYDIGTLIDKNGVAVRTGNHCAEPLVHHYGINGTTRASFGLYNTKQEADMLVKSIIKASGILMNN